MHPTLFEQHHQFQPLDHTVSRSPTNNIYHTDQHSTTALAVNHPFGSPCPDRCTSGLQSTAAAASDADDNGPTTEHIHDEAVPILTGADHDDDGGGGGGDGRGCSDEDMEYIMSDFRQMCGRRRPAATMQRISLSCLDEPLHPQALHSMLMELDGAVQDLDAMIGSARCHSPIGGGGGDGLLSSELADCWID